MKELNRSRLDLETGKVDIFPFHNDGLSPQQKAKHIQVMNKFYEENGENIVYALTTEPITIPLSIFQ
jgi:hypothetical protein